MWESERESSPLNGMCVMSIFLNRISDKYSSVAHAPFFSLSRSLVSFRFFYYLIRLVYAHHLALYSTVSNCTLISSLSSSSSSIVTLSYSFLYCTCTYTCRCVLACIIPVSSTSPFNLLISCVYFHILRRWKNSNWKS
jgi:hypothetical protein